MSQRIIKFRFWSKVLNAFVIPDDNILVGTFKDEKMVVMQYTGLKDKNGKEIYEGDILVNIERKGEEPFKIDNIIPVNRFYGNSPHDDDWINWSEMYKIIGNIYQNPELLD